MTLKDWREEINYFTEELSSQIRVLCYSGIAIVWMFKGDRSSLAKPDALLLALFLFILSLFVDLCFLWYSAHIANEAFNNKELILGTKKKKKKIEDADTGGWNPCYVCHKKWLRIIRLFLCINGYLVLGYYVFETNYK